MKRRAVLRLLGLAPLAAAVPSCSWIKTYRKWGFEFVWHGGYGACIEYGLLDLGEHPRQAEFIYNLNAGRMP